MDEDATWYGSRPPRRPHCIRRVPSAPRKGHSTPASFRPMSIVAMVAHLSYCWALVVKCYQCVDLLLSPCYKRLPRHSSECGCTVVWPTWNVKRILWKIVMVNEQSATLPWPDFDLEHRPYSIWRIRSRTHIQIFQIQWIRPFGARIRIRIRESSESSFDVDSPKGFASETGSDISVTNVNE